MKILWSAIALHLLTIVGSVPLSVKSSTENDISQMCTSKECIEVSYRILKAMNTSADPCDDFYKFTCGNFLAETIIPDDKSSWTAFEPIEEDIYSRGRILLESDPLPDDFESYQLARDHYKSCIDEEKQEELGVQPILERLQKFGGWPVLEGEKWNENKEKFSPWEWTYKTSEEGFDNDHLISFTLSPDSKNSTIRLLQIDQADPGMSREYLVKGFDDKDVQAYYRYAVESAVLLGASEDVAKVELRESLLFEIELANITTAREDRRNATAMYNPVIVGEAIKYKNLPDWTDFIQNMYRHIDTIKLDAQEKVNIVQPDYLEKLDNLLEKTDKRVVANYLGWRAVKTVMRLLNEEARRIRQRYRKVINGNPSQSPTWKRCVEEVGFNSFESSNLIFVASSMYVKKYFNSEAKQEMVDMTNYIRKAFEDVILEKLDWMDGEVKQRAKVKLAEMEQFIGFSDEFLNKSKVDELHKDIQIKADDLFGNTFHLAKFWRTFNYKKLRDVIDRNSWLEHYYVALVNALYFPENNYMEFPAGILQGAFYTPNVPKYVNFGSIGVVIGHEITHGFDDEGKQRNELGEIENWWDKSTEESYTQKAQCMIDQYSNYTAKQVGMNIDGKNNIGENIADNGGIKEAYAAYQRWVADHGDEQTLPGLPYNARQVFWIRFGQLWCSKHHDSALRELILTDYHSPGEFRVIGPLSNNEDFAKDYNCPAGSFMNPVKKCVVW